MKYMFSMILLLLVTVANATERVNLTCKFDAVAAGYVSKVYSVNMILEGNAIYNADGSHGNNRNAIFANGSTNTDTKYSDFSFQVYDGNEYRRLRSGDGLKYNIPSTWTLNTGEVTCVMKRGWGSSYYGDNIKTIHDTVYVPKIQYLVIHDTVDNIIDNPDPLVEVIHDTVVKIVKDSVLDSSKATQRFSLRGKYVGLALNETDCEFYINLLKYNDTVFNEQGEYVDSFEIKCYYPTGVYYKTTKLNRKTLIGLIGGVKIYPNNKGNFYITTEKNWNNVSLVDWSLAKVSKDIQNNVDKLKSELGHE